MAGDVAGLAPGLRWGVVERMEGSFGIDRSVP
jgi:hypothetical protein